MVPWRDQMIPSEFKCQYWEFKAFMELRYPKRTNWLPQLSQNCSAPAMFGPWKDNTKGGVNAGPLNAWYVDSFFCKCS
jgi:hypothetical protein